MNNNSSIYFSRPDALQQPGHHSSHDVVLEDGKEK
jgi:hypothetical protein